jgi:hypothetical protein
MSLKGNTTGGADDMKRHKNNVYQLSNYSIKSIYVDGRMIYFNKFKTAPTFKAMFDLLKSKMPGNILYLM